MAKQQKLPIKFPPHAIGGVYSNQMMISHTREEFLMDFINLFPPEGVVNARVIVSPGHLKRMIRALSDNLARYEAKHGPIVEATADQVAKAKNIAFLASRSNTLMSIPMVMSMVGAGKHGWFM